MIHAPRTIAATCIAALLSTGCATHDTPQPTPTTDTAAPPAPPLLPDVFSLASDYAPSPELARLIRRELDQTASPPSASDAPLPPSRMPLDTAVTHALGNTESPAPATSPASPAEAQRAEQLRTDAELALVTNDPLAAVRSLREAARLTPDDAALWQELAAAALAAENRALARTAFERALDLGDTTPDTTQPLATLASEAGQHRLALRAAAITLDNKQLLSPTELTQTRITLGRALDNLGYSLAAAVSWTDALATPNRTINDATSTRLLLDAATRFREAGELNAAQSALERAATADTPAIRSAALREAARIALERRQPARALALTLTRAASQPVPPPDTVDLLRATRGAGLDPQLLEAEFRRARNAAPNADSPTAAANIAWTIALAASVADPAARADRFAEPLAQAPHDLQLLSVIIDATTSLPTTEQRDALAALIERLPHRATIITTAITHQLSGDTLRTLADPGLTPVGPARTAQLNALPPDQLALTLRLAARIEQRPIDADRARRNAEQSESPAALATALLALTQTGLGPQADQLATERVTSNPDPSTHLALARFHLDRENPRAALADADAALATLPSAAPETAEAHLLRARALNDQRYHARALESLDNAIAIHPASAEALHARSETLRSMNAEPADIRAAEDALIRAAPDSPQARTAAAHHTLDEGRRPEALAELERLARAPGAPDAAIALLARHAPGPPRGERTFPEAIQLFQQLAAANPHDQRYTVALIALLSEIGRLRDVLLTTRSVTETFPGHTAVINATAATLAANGASPTQVALAEQPRFDQLPNTLTATLERAAAALVAEGIEAAARTIEDTADSFDHNANPAETAALIALAARALNRTDPDIPNTFDAARRILDAANRFNAELPSSLRLAHLELAGETLDPSDTARILELFDLAATDDPSNAAEAAINTAQRLRRRAQTDDSSAAIDTALALLKRAIASTNPPSAAAEQLRIITAVSNDRTADLARAITEAIQRNRLPQTLAGAADGPPPIDPDQSDPFDIALARFAASNLAPDHFNLSESLWRYVLDRDPDDPNAANSWGYYLLERNERIDFAAELIERAHAAMPDSSAVTDSLGWARYKQGIFNDTPDRRGAISLLRESIRLAQDAPDADEPFQRVTAAVAADHLGDALWAAGRREQAIDAWTRAAAIAQETLDQSADTNLGTISSRELNAVTARAPAKIRDASADREPAIAHIPARKATRP